MIYYVSKNGSNSNSGEISSPFLTINHAAQLAMPGDTVKVFGGEYREWVSPKNSGEENNRIIYESVDGETPIIKGSETITDWEFYKDNVWKKVINNSLFGDWNPYKETVRGDWYLHPNDYEVHLGEVYLNGVAMYEAKSLEDVLNATLRNTEVKCFIPNSMFEPENTIYQWYATVEDETTTIWCNFQNVNPNESLVEINVRKCCFYPEQTGRNYITLRGFEIAHAACPFTPPTADQPGMVGTHWSKGWIIENNILHDAKCSAISIGKESSTGDNDHSNTFRKSGYTYQKEAVFAAIQIGWSKDTIGSHLIQNNIIHHCGQNGIVGHLGCVFSTIKHNHIYKIAYKQEFYGYELGAIKLHAAIDVTLENNNIHDCSCFGTWLDWQAQGTRVTKNVYHNNQSADLVIEVSHGPCTVDNNIFLSTFNLGNVSQGTALVHNIFAGALNCTTALDRQTPYHFPHSTAVKGSEAIYGGDDRIINNIFLGKYAPSSSYLQPFCASFDKYCLPHEYLPRIKSMYGQDHGAYLSVPQSVTIESNVYSGHSLPYRAEKNHIITTGIKAELYEENKEFVLELTVNDSVLNMECQPITTERLGTPRLTEELFENPDGTPIDFSADINNNLRTEKILPGPFASLNKNQHVTVWKP